MSSTNMAGDIESKWRATSKLVEIDDKKKELENGASEMDGINNKETAKVNPNLAGDIEREQRATSTIGDGHQRGGSLPHLKGGTACLDLDLCASPPQSQQQRKESRRREGVPRPFSREARHSSQQSGSGGVSLLCGDDAKNTTGAAGSLEPSVALASFAPACSVSNCFVVDDHEHVGAMHHDLPACKDGAVDKLREPVESKVSCIYVVCEQ